MYFFYLGFDFDDKVEIFDEPIIKIESLPEICQEVIKINIVQQDPTKDCTEKVPTAKSLTPTTLGQKYIRLKPIHLLLPITSSTDHSYSKPIPLVPKPLLWHHPQPTASPNEVATSLLNIGPFKYSLGDEVLKSMSILNNQQKNLSQDQKNQKIESLLDNLKRSVYHDFVFT